ncbi:MAG: DUF805 domain-containing protein, partial [Desulfobulbia bacterium]
MEFGESIRTVLSKYATFNGRATRPEYWWWILALFLLSAVTQLIDAAVIAPMLGFDRFEEDAGQPLSLLAGLALLVPSLAVACRRLHDIGRSGWWLLIGLIPVIGLLVLLYWYVQPSE